jgi:NAD(P)-dependent dehydrogenase (short-subunit alcohol dehydrogenase family)
MILKDKTIVITGSAGGLGKAMAHRLGKQGANIVLSDIQNDKLQETVEEFKKKESRQLEFKLMLRRKMMPLNLWKVLKKNLAVLMLRY